MFCVYLLIEIFMEREQTGFVYSLIDINLPVKAQKNLDMADILTKQETIDEIVKHAKKLDKMELQILLTRLRIKRMLREGIKPGSQPPQGR